MVNIFITSCILLEYSIKALGSFKCFNPMLSVFLIKNWYLPSYGSLAYKYILSISGWLFIKFSNAFVFPDTEPPIIDIVYGYSVIYGQLGLCFLLFSLVYSSQFILYNWHYHAVLLYLFPPKSCDTIICIVTQIFLLYLFPPESCDTINCVVTQTFLLYLFSPKSCDTITFIVNQIFLLYLITSSLDTHHFFIFLLFLFLFLFLLTSLVVLSLILKIIEVIFLNITYLILFAYSISSVISFSTIILFSCANLEVVLTTLSLQTCKSISS